jgi:ribokinase
MPPRVLVVGSINMDLIVRCRAVPKAGETVHGQEFRTAPGGKGANQAVACARLGAQTTMVGRVGEDEFGQSLRRGLVGDGVDVASVLVDGEAASGVALILLEAEGRNRIVVIGGANQRLDEQDVARASALLGQSDLVLMQLEIPLPVVRDIATAARARGVKTVLDAGAATPAAAELGLPALVDVVSPNEPEAEALTGIAVQDVADASRAADRLHAMGAAEVVLKLGSRGALWSRAGAARYFPAFAVSPVDTTAAGDAFTGALAVSLAAGADMAAALVRANAAGALACLKLGAQPSMPTAAEVDEFLGSRAPKAEE